MQYCSCRLPPRLLMLGAFVLSLMLGGLPAAPARADEVADPVVAQRGAVTLTASEVRKMLDMMDPDQRELAEHDPAVLAQRVRERVLQMVVLDRAHAEKWEERPEVQYRAELAREAAVADSYVNAKLSLDPEFPNEQQVGAAYEANKAKFMLPRQYHLAQILLTVPHDASEQTVAEVQQRAVALRKVLTDGSTDFAAVAKQKSDEKATAANGGDVGWLREEALLPPIRTALATMAPGAVSDPVRTPDGWHLVKLLGVKPAGQATLAEARETLVRLMRQERLMQAQRRYLSELLQEEPVKLDQVELWKQVAR